MANPMRSRSRLAIVIATIYVAICLWCLASSLVGSGDSQTRWLSCQAVTIPWGIVATLVPGYSSWGDFVLFAVHFAFTWLNAALLYFAIPLVGRLIAWLETVDKSP